MAVVVQEMKVTSWDCLQLMWLEGECHFSKDQRAEIKELAELWQQYLASLPDKEASLLKVKGSSVFGFKSGWHGADIFMYGSMFWFLLDSTVHGKLSEEERVLLAKCERIFQMANNRVTKIMSAHNLGIPVLPSCRLVLGSPQARNLNMETVDLLTTDVEILFGKV